MVRPHLTQAERDLIATLCEFLTENRRNLLNIFPCPFADFTEENWSQVQSITAKLTQLELPEPPNRNPPPTDLHPDDSEHVHLLIHHLPGPPPAPDAALDSNSRFFLY
jgi:hypothetical protein